jgi:hypothetical protein
MKEMISVRSNCMYDQRPDDKAFKLHPMMELVIIHTNGKNYTLDNSGKLTGKPAITDVRMVVSPEMLSGLITELQLHQKKLEALRQNADKINTLIQYVQEEKKPECEHDWKSVVTRGDQSGSVRILRSNKCGAKKP